MENIKKHFAEKRNDLYARYRPAKTQVDKHDQNRSLETRPAGKRPKTKGELTIGRR